MDDQPLLPRRVILLGRALRSLCHQLQTQLDAPVLPVVPALGMDDEVPYRIHALQGTLTRLVDACNRLMTDVVSNAHDGDAQVGRAVARLAHGIDELLAGRQEIRSLNVPWPHMEARDLLAGVYRHHLIEVRDWLAELLETLDHPEAALRRRGLPAHGSVDLHLTLTLTPALQLHRLSDWMERRSAERGEPVPRAPAPSWWRKVGAFGVGWAVGNALFDDDCGCDGDA